MSVDKPGVEAKAFREPADPPGKLTTDTVLFGIDATEMMGTLLDRMEGRELTPEESDGVYTRAVSGRT